MALNNYDQSFTGAVTRSVIGIIAAVLVVGFILIPICDAAGHERVEFENEGPSVSPVRAGWTATLTTDGTEDGDYVLLGASVSVKNDGGMLVVTGIGYGTRTMAEAEATYDGTVLTIAGTPFECAWAFVPDEDGQYRYGTEAFSDSVDKVWSLGEQDGFYFSVKGADDVTAGAVM